MSDITRLLEKPYLSVGIFGVGTSNVGVINYLVKKNPTLRLTVRSDTTPDLSGLTNVDRIFAGKDAFSNIGEEILLLSPSVRRDRKEIQAAASNGVLLSSDAELYFALTDKAPISVTGSDGKSTTTHLIAKAYSESGINAVPCGNYGKSLCSTLGDNALQVAELSSFQLNFMKPHSKAAIITNITPNHLNWHTSFDEYVEAKMNVTDNAEKLIYDADSTVTVNALMNREAFAKTSLFLSYPKLKAIGGSENFITYENGIIYVNGSPYIDVSKAKRKEHYNVRNFMLTAASCIDACQEKCIEDALVNFTGLPHRAEVFFEDRGIKYIDSSIDSSPERTIKTLSALSDNTVAIIGGMGKGLSLDKLSNVLPALTNGAVLLGEVGYNLASMLSAEHGEYKFLTAEDLYDATRKAKKLLGGKGTVILSPAATSFDRYKNFIERGKSFKQIILSLASSDD